MPETPRSQRRVWNAAPPIAALLVVSMWLSGLILEVAFAGLSTSFSDLGSTKTVYDALALSVGIGAMASVGAVLIVRRRSHPVGWLLGALGGVVGLGQGLSSYTEWQLRGGAAAQGLVAFGAWFNGFYWLTLVPLLLFLILILFPDGRLPSRRWRLVSAAVVIAHLLGLVTGLVPERIWLKGQRLPGSSDLSYDMCITDPSRCWPSIDNPIGVPGIGPLEGELLFLVLTVGSLVGLAAAFAAALVRFRRSQGVERLQLRWFTAAVGSGLFLILTVPLDLPDLVGVLTLSLWLALIPVAIGVAILRYRLFEIDRIVSRTVTYTVVVGVLLGVYTGLVIGVRGLLDPVTGESNLALAVSTLVVAVLFGPLLRRVRTGVDRRFNRSRFDAAQAAAALAARLRDEVDIEAITADLYDTVGSTLAPTTMTLWLRQNTP